MKSVDDDSRYRVDEVARLRDDVRQLREALGQQGIHSAVITQRLDQMEKDLAALQSHSAETYVPIARYTPVEKIVFGLVALVLMAVIGAMVGAVVAP